MPVQIHSQYKAPVNMHHKTCPVWICIKVKYAHVNILACKQQLYSKQQMEVHRHLSKPYLWTKMYLLHKEQYNGEVNWCSIMKENRHFGKTKFNDTAAFLDNSISLSLTQTCCTTDYCTFQPKSKIYSLSKCITKSQSYSDTQERIQLSDSLALVRLACSPQFYLDFTFPKTCSEAFSKELIWADRHHALWLNPPAFGLDATHRRFNVPTWEGKYVLLLVLSMVTHGLDWELKCNRRIQKICLRHKQHICLILRSSYALLWLFSIGKLK